MIIKHTDPKPPQGFYLDMGKFTVLAGQTRKFHHRTVSDLASVIPKGKYWRGRRRPSSFTTATPSSCLIREQGLCVDYDGDQDVVWELLV